jgi:hypothetical protein
MSKLGKSILRKLLLVLALLNILMCPLMFLAGTFFPRTLGFLDPTLCSPGMHLGNETMSQSDLRGNITAMYIICTDGHQEVDVTGKMLVTLFGLPILGVILLVAWAFVDPGKKPKGPAAPKAQA